MVDFQTVVGSVSDLILKEDQIVDFTAYGGFHYPIDMSTVLTQMDITVADSTNYNERVIIAHKGGVCDENATIQVTYNAEGEGSTVSPITTTYGYIELAWVATGFRYVGEYT